MLPDAKKARLRFDFVVEILATDEETRTVRFLAKPNPLRYEWRTENNETHLYDKLDNLLIPEQIYRRALEGLKGMPISFEPQAIGDAAEYVRSRQPSILAFLNGQIPLQAHDDAGNRIVNGRVAISVRDGAERCEAGDYRRKK